MNPKWILCLKDFAQRILRQLFPYVSDNGFFRMLFLGFDARGVFGSPALGLCCGLEVLM